jgi:hypothetical protein
VTLYTPAGELIVVQQCGAPELQRWALSTIRAPTQEDAPLGGKSLHPLRFCQPGVVSNSRLLLIIRQRHITSRASSWMRHPISHPMA